MRPSSIVLLIATYLFVLPSSYAFSATATAISMGSVEFADVEKASVAAAGNAATSNTQSGTITRYGQLSFPFFEPPLSLFSVPLLLLKLVSGKNK
jgi:hypothetical protein